jgi:excisionase family DNA binding protein
MPPTYLSTCQVANLAEVDRKTIRSWVRQGLMPQPIVLGHNWRFNADEIHRWLKARQAEPVITTDDGDALPARRASAASLPSGRQPTAIVGFLDALLQDLSEQDQCPRVAALASELLRGESASSGPEEAT